MPLTAYIKPTNYCTVDCDHCYLSVEVRANKLSMSDDTLRQSARLLMDLAKKEGQDSLHIIWHGGEPMMLSPEWYEHAISILDEEIGPNKYTQGIQTSMIPYKETWDHLIKTRFDSFLGSSIDFTQRKIAKSTDSYKNVWLKRVNKARKQGFTIVPSMVPSRFEVGHGKAIVEWFEENDFPAFNIERYSDIGSDKLDATKNIHHSKFLVEVFDAVLDRLKQGLRVSQINVVTAGIRGVLLGQPGDRWGGKCQREFIVIEPDGSTNTCPDRTSFESSFANVSEGAVGFISSPQRKQWIRIQNSYHKEDHCNQCEFSKWCKSGCPIANNKLNESETECSGYKKYLLHIKEALSNPVYKDLLVNYIKPLGEPINAKEKLI
ncbi:SPASM domain-containing protein [Psychromonas sp. SP041]|uniref:radical SAM/SPASM domain-containing protein n=1 Tax=Psychromonas sp. SP041 TaxID=1365007 RepID=UPI0010C7DF69|nr:SPASM domain-containing protein [Psychromonas sp. SP041]